jgi:hypothetical protein
MPSFEGFIMRVKNPKAYFIIMTISWKRQQARPAGKKT